MKKIAILTILIFISGIMISCNDTSSSDTVTGYIDQGNWTGMTTNSSKDYTLAPFGVQCGPGAHCLAIIYQGTQYVGIAVKNASGTANLKIYWEAASIPTGPQTISSCTVNYNGTVTNNVTITVNITDNTTINAANGTYHILFTGGVTGTTIVNTNYIDALKI